MRLATWNVRTLNYSPGNVRPERSTALVARELQRYNIDIAALTETRLPDSGTLTERGAGYTFYWQGKPSTEKRQSGVGFAIKSDIKLTEFPIGHSDRIMTLRLSIGKNRYLHIISAYAPTMQHAETTKNAFYQELSDILHTIRACDKTIIMGDFNARVGRDYSTWVSVLGKHGIGNANSNGNLLLSLCSEHKLRITNTQFQLPNKLKTTWRHARSGHWHLIDYIITKQSDAPDFLVTRVMRGADCWTDHRLLIARVKLHIKKPTRKNGSKVPKKYCVARLKEEETADTFRESVASQLPDIDDTNWDSLKKALLNSAETILGHIKHHHKDWFDDNDAEIRKLLDQRANTQIDKRRNINREIKNKLRQMKEKWWQQRAAETQLHADNGNTRGLFQSLKYIYGPKKNATVPVFSLDGKTLLTSTEDKKERWTEHFTQLLSETSTVSDSVINTLPQRPEETCLDEILTIQEVEKAISQIKDNKSAGPDGIPPELFTHGGQTVATHLHRIFVKIWIEEVIPADMRNANIITIFKKNDRHNVNNYRGISILAVVGKIMALVMLNRMRDPIAETVLPESQGGFRRNRGTTDMIFAVRQLMEKAREQHRNLYIAFVDFTKAFDSVNRNALWVIMKKMGCPPKFVAILKCLHRDMTVRILVDNELTSEIPYNNGVKQGCILAPTLFAIFAAAMFMHAFSDSPSGVSIRFRSNGSLFNLARLRSQSKCMTTLLHEFQYADDCALTADSEEALQDYIDSFADAASSFGLKINCKKTEVMALQNSAVRNPLSVNGTHLPNVHSFKYLGSTVTDDCRMDKELDCRIQCATTSFGRLWDRLWSSHDISNKTKISVYKAAITSALLFGAETWTLYQRHFVRLRRVQQRHLRAILRVPYTDRITNDQILDRAGVPDIEMIVRKMQLRWAGHVARMSDNRIPKQLLFGELTIGTRTVGRPLLRWKDSLKDTLKQSNISITHWQDTATDRSAWRRSIHDGLVLYDDSRRERNATKRARRHAARNATSSASQDAYMCRHCGRTSSSRIGILSHERACNKQKRT